MCDSSVGIGSTIKWGDGSTTSGEVTGSNATGTHVNSLYTIIGEHICPHRGTYHGIVIVTAGNATAVRAHFHRGVAVTCLPMCSSPWCARDLGSRRSPSVQSS
jgi:hypothetical protein